MSYERQRHLALATRPAEMVEALNRPGALVQSHDGLDETWVATTHVEWEEHGCLVERTVWWFDEASLTWAVDSSDTWELDAATATALSAALQEPGRAS